MGPATNDKLKLLGATFAFGGTLVLGMGFVYLFLSPKTFEATTRLRVVDWVKKEDLQKPTDERVVFVECDLIRSNVVVDPVIKSLHLAEAWGERFNQGAPLSLEAARARLDASTKVAPVPHSSVIDIRVESEDATETDKIANALAHSYLDYRHERHLESIREKLAGLKQQWDAQNEKVRDAQIEVDKLYVQIIRQRSTNHSQYYDPKSYDLLVANRAQLRAKLVDQQSQLAGLKKMDHEQLKDVLSSMDTNSPLSTALLQLNKAKSEVLKARLNNGEDSSETREAALRVDRLSANVSQQVDAAMVVRQTDLEGLENMIKDLEVKIKTARTNDVKPTIEDETYKKAVEQLKQLKLDRDNLQSKLDEVESRDAINPTGIRADILETAETPLQPFMPDPKVAVGTMIAGAVGIVVGFIFWIVSTRPKAATRNAAVQR